MKTFYIADTHFGHAAAINFDKRPFNDTEEMEHVMVMLWNTAIKPGDRVFIIGDFCWQTKNEWIRLLKLLNGQKYIINGNHDLLSYPEEVMKYLVGVYDYKKINDDGRKVIMSHFPILTYEKSNDPNYYMLHGHVHKTKENDYLEQWKQQLREDAKTAKGLHVCNLAQIYNVGSMMPWMNYVPRTLDEIIRKEKEYRENQKKEMKLLTADEICWNVERNTQLFVVQKDESENWNEGRYLQFIGVFSFIDMNYAEFSEIPTGLNLEDYGMSWKAYL